MNEFLQLPNFKRCEAMWRQYMMEHHQVSVPNSETDSRPRKLLFQIMSDVRENYAQEPDVDLRTLNNVSMNLARDVFLRKGVDVPHQQITQPQQHQQQSLERDQAVYAGRKSTNGAPRPEATSRIQDTQYTEHLSLDLPHHLQLGESDSPHVTDNPIDEAETARRLAGRDEDALLAAILRQPPVVAAPRPQPRPDVGLEPGPASGPFHAKIPTDDSIRASNDRVGQSGHLEGFTNPSTQTLTLPSSAEEGRGYSALLQNAPKTVIFDKYVIVNGFDRYWQQSPLRYQYTVTVGSGGNGDHLNKGLQGSYRNIHSLQVTRLVIPMEIVPSYTYKGIQTSQPFVSGTIANAVKGSYRHAASLSFPYVMLTIDGFNDIYDGTNGAARRAFCQLVYCNSYKAPNGRGFVILEPMQKEKKIFTPSPLASLNRLNISILTPSGALFNNSTDDSLIHQIQYETCNRQYIRIVVEKYFDMNDFYVGDSIVIQDFLSSQPAALPGNSWVPDPIATYDTLNTYINRSEGHEIVEIGLPNNSGFFRSFCIMAPGTLDARVGNIVLDAGCMAALVEMNLTNTPCPLVAFGGALLNMSLQNVVSFKLGVLGGDAPQSFAV